MTTRPGSSVHSARTLVEVALSSSEQQLDQPDATQELVGSRSGTAVTTVIDVSPFLEVDPEHWLASNQYAFAIRDRFPVSPGHALIVPRREIASWWDASTEEQHAMLDLLDVVKMRLEAEHSPHGFNVGFNAGEAAGQTIDHLHLHVIPRFSGDVDDPRGGIRHVIPKAGNYLVETPQSQRTAALVTPFSGGLRLQLVRAFIRTDLDRIDLLVSFIMQSGIRVIAPHLDEAIARGANVRILTTDYLQITDPSALGMLLDRAGEHDNVQLRVFSEAGLSFHPKAYIFSSSSSAAGLAFVGSSNLSRSGIETGIEWNLETSNLRPIQDEFERLWVDDRSRTIDHAWLRSYEDSRQDSQQASEVVQQPPSAPTDEEIIARANTGSEEDATPKPWSVQDAALSALASTRIEQYEAGLVVMATGLGKTWLAAFDSTRPQFRRVLFIAHREEILKQARDIFRQLRPSSHLSMFLGREQDTEGDVVFAGVQLLSQRLDQFDPDAFDYIIVDEFHHAAAPTYRRVISHFRPSFLLGLTATPNRADSADLLALCADNLVYECDMGEGIRLGLLSPFRYRAIPDVADYEHIPWRSGRFDPTALTNEIATERRARQVYDEWLSADGPKSRAIAFCASVVHADFMAAYFRQRGTAAVAVHSSPTSSPREDSLQQLANGTTPILFTVDLFNEGVDVPQIDLILMLRPTESDIVFTQQLGRGLRRADNKSQLNVIDLVGNHRSFLRKARLLASLAGLSNATQREFVDYLAQNRASLSEGDSLPEGCSIILDPEVIDLLTALIGRPTNEDRLVSLIREWAQEHDGQRPTALELATLTQSSLSVKKNPGWFGLLDELGLLPDEEAAVLREAGDLLTFIESGSYTKSYKLVTLQALLQLNQLRTVASVSDIAQTSRWFLFRDSSLRADLSDAQTAFVDPMRPTALEWLAYWKKNPIAALTNGKTESGPFFAVHDDRWMPLFTLSDHLGPTFDAMVGELVDYQLWRYVSRRSARLTAESRKPTVDGQELDATFTVESSGGVASSIVIESAGGTRNTPKARNPDYVAGFDRVLLRLAQTGFSLADAHIDTGASKHLTLAERRLDPGEGRDFPIELGAEQDLVGLRKALLQAMARVGRSPGAKGSSGNQRKRTRLVISSDNPWEAKPLAQEIAGTGPDTSPADEAEVAHG